MRAGVCALALSCALLASGCNSLPGKPAPGPEVPRPDSVLSPQVLFAQNCAGCHGVEGQNGPATPLASPVYQALVDDATLHRVISRGLPGSMMPAFAQSAGGELTDAQVDAIVHGIRANWKKGDAKAGELVYANNCANFHGPAGGKVGEAGSVLNPDFLTLMAPQTFRTTVIVGRPDLGMPDWRDQMDDPMTAQQVSDVVAFLMVQKPNAPKGSTQGLQATQGAAHQPAHQPKMSGGAR